MRLSTRNMSKSLLSNDRVCLRCGTPYNLHKHHIYPSAFRNKSEKYGAWCYLCFNHHVGNEGVHTSKGTEYWLYLKALCQERFEEKYSHELFMKEFKKDWRYLYDKSIKR